MQKTYIGIDMGGTTLEGGLVSSKGRVLETFTTLVPIRYRKRLIIQQVVKNVRELLQASKECAGIGLGWPAAVNIPVKGYLVKSRLERAFDLPVFLDNDANCFTLAESLAGKGKHHPIVVGITLGTGIGGGLVIDHKIYHGRREAPEIGHTTLDYNGPQCPCGNSGCFEEYVGKKGIAWLARKYDLPTTDGYGLYTLAKRGNIKALRAWREMGKYLGIGLVNVINSYDPDVIILGGKISRAWKFFSLSMRKEILKRSFIRPCPIRISSLKNSAIIGSAMLAKQALTKQ
ncbi:ROK family protein [Patescibacteria group bacterium]|nr:ROK family protein [Patescibacteria group bacterium]